MLQDSSAERKSYTAFLSGLPRFQKFLKSDKDFLKSKIGKDARVQIQYDSNGFCTGFGFIYFKSIAERDAACLVSLKKWNISKCHNKRLAQAFPELSAEKRLNLKIDQESYYSLTAGYTAKDMAQASFAIVQCLSPGKRLCIDCTAGSGGNTVEFIKSKCFDRVVAIEVEKQRSQDLMLNLELTLEGLEVSEWSVVNSECIDWLFSSNIQLFDLLFFDPPWGGVDYRKTSQSCDYSLGNEKLSLSTIFSHEFTFGKLKGKVKVAALKIPSIFDATQFAKTITDSNTAWSKTNDLDERPHPFHLNMGSRIDLMIIAYPPFAKNALLNDLIESLRNFDLNRASVFKPRYWDWEKQCWISLKRFKGFSGSKAKLK